MRAVAAHTDDPLTSAAVPELVAQLEAGLAGDVPVAGLVFASPGYDNQALVDALGARWPDLALIGGSADAEGSSVLGFCEDSVCALLLVGDFRAAVGSSVGAHADPFAAGARAAQAAIDAVGSKPAVCFAMVEAITGSAGRATAGVASVLAPLGVPVFGGAAADDQRFDTALQFTREQVLHDSVVVLALAGDLEVGHAVASGYLPTGAVARITRSTDNVVFEVDGAPALAHYRDYMGDLAVPSSSFPVTLAGAAQRSLAATVRSPLFADEGTGAITFAGDMPEGCAVRFAISEGRDALIDAAAAAVRSARGWLSGPPEVALFFSCTGRRDVLGTRTAEECGVLAAHLDDAPYAGFYGYGEIGPTGGGHRADLHNLTFVCAMIRERS